MAEDHNAFREGAITGLIGATAIAIWFFVVDLIAGHPLYTPQMLGGGLLNLFGRDPTDSAMLQITIYTIFHLLAFVLVGVLLTVIVHAGERTPGVFAGVLILIVVLELGFYGFAGLMENTAMGNLAWWQVMVANVIAASLMLWYMWKRHPAMRGRFVQALEGTDDQEQPTRVDTQPTRIRS
jgi:hypothetical protein